MQCDVIQIKFENVIEVGKQSVLMNFWNLFKSDLNKSLNGSIQAGNFCRIFSMEYEYEWNF